MKAFEYALPETEQEAVELLAGPRGQTEVLAGGTDLVGLMKKMIVTPERVVSLSRVESLKQIEGDSQGVRIGAMATLEDWLDHPLAKNYPALEQAARAIGSLQLQSQGTIGGEFVPAAALLVPSAMHMACWLKADAPWPRETTASPPSLATPARPSSSRRRAWLQHSSH